MKSKTLRNIKVISLLTILLCAIFTTLSCDNLFSDVTTNYTPTSDTTSPAGDGNRTVTITGTISNPYEQARNNSRSAMPSYAYSDKKYVVTATASDGSGTVSGTGNTTDNTFAIPLSLGKTWTINVQLLKKETDNTGGTGDTDYVKVMEGSYSFTEALTELVSGINIEIKPSITSDGTGNIALVFAAPTDQLCDRVDAEPVSEEQKALWNAAFPFDENGINRNGISTTGISGTGIKSGVYSVTIRFYKSNVLVYATMQEITVYNNMTTNMWDGSGSNGPINSGTFTVTQALIDTFKRTSIFVASTTNNPAGSNANSGTPYKPLASISKALQYISVTGNGEAYTIWLMSNITESVELTTDTITTSKASSITIRPMQNPVTVTGRTRTVFEVETSVPITFENLTITGGTATFTGGGIYIDNGAEVTLANCTVTGNSVTGSGSVGGGIFNSGTLKIKGKTNITGNTSGSDADVKTDNLFLPDDKNITVSGTLDEDSRIGVTTATKPGYGSPVAFTTGFHANSGLSDTAISSIFRSDEGYAVVASSSGEATLQASGGNINNVFDYAVTLSCEDTIIAPGSIITVAAAVTKGAEAVAVTAPEDLSWNFTLYCYGDEVASMTAAAGVGYGSFQVPTNLHIFGGVNYVLHASAVYCGVAYDKDFKLTGYSSSVPYGFVAVTGATVTGAVRDSTGAVRDSYVFVEGGTKVIPNMYVCDHEVTQAEYLAIMGLTQQSILSADYGLGNNYPAYNMSWFDMLVYCNKRSIAEGLTPCYMIKNSTNPDSWGEVPDSATHTNYAAWNAVICDFNADGYRLPTEAEWEYAARGGNDGIPATQYKYSGSDTIDDVAWHDSSSSHEVKKKTANSLGIYDMSGNVWERCWDLGTNAQGAAGRAVRGGSASVGECVVEGKNFYDVPELHKNDDGFRVVRTAPGTPLASGTDGTAGTDATYMYFGEWPQTIIADGVTVDESISKQMGMFTYYFGSDGAWYVEQAENGRADAADTTYSDGTAVAQGGTRYKYFKVEPIKWRVLTTNYNGTGKKLLLAENILTNGTYHPSETRTIGGVTVYHHNWQYSRIRAYLNGTDYNLSGTQNNEFVGKGFLQTAFTSSLQSKIVTSLLDNSAATAPENTPEAYLCENTYDNVFFLSGVESGSYGLNNASRIRAMTDFAKATGACGDWWLRTPGGTSNSNPCLINTNGTYTTFNAIYGYHGIVPALCIDD